MVTSVPAYRSVTCCFGISVWVHVVYYFSRIPIFHKVVMDMSLASM